jgi:hypothetical protein
VRLEAGPDGPVPLGFGSAPDVIYSSLPNGLRACWTADALTAGKHRALRGTLAANAAQTREVQAVQR